MVLISRLGTVAMDVIHPRSLSILTTMMHNASLSSGLDAMPKHYRWEASSPKHIVPQGHPKQDACRKAKRKERADQILESVR